MYSSRKTVKHMGKDLEGNGLGKGFRQKADGRFEARVYIPGVKNPYCLYDRKLSTLKKKTREFKKKKAPLAERYNPQINVSVWYEEWMRLYIIPVNKNTTIQNYVNGFERMREYIGYVKLSDATPSTISCVIDSLLTEGYARTTVLQALSILRQLFQHAFNRGLVPTNPCDTIRFSKDRPGKIPDDDKKCISPQDLERFWEVCQRRRYYEPFCNTFSYGNADRGSLCARME